MYVHALIQPVYNIKAKYVHAPIQPVYNIKTK